MLRGGDDGDNVGSGGGNSASGSMRAISMLEAYHKCYQMQASQRKPITNEMEKELQNSNSQRQHIQNIQNEEQQTGFFFHKFVICESSFSLSLSLPARWSWNSLSFEKVFSMHGFHTHFWWFSHHHQQRHASFAALILCGMVFWSSFQVSDHVMIVISGDAFSLKFLSLISNTTALLLSLSLCYGQLWHGKTLLTGQHFIHFNDARVDWCLLFSLAFCAHFCWCFFRHHFHMYLCVAKQKREESDSQAHICRLKKRRANKKDRKQGQTRQNRVIFQR